ncbi:type I restriction enzyme, S subunit [[Clostridium] aminophilum]|uniref:Type I restriction enzyme, S subunit n=1 Tax=[Clostridium] aminophilum TaxID=1526 RepID=A0A1I0FE18_9FIRM|nr:restriction endonuclease subunit S [[Clostridium] aminophilum]SET56428.1 type I restriction enzyme, S subunit [[Clostridium] aminophilum]
MTKLTDLCDIQYGYAFDSGAFSDDESYPQLVRIRDVKRGYSETYYNGEYPEEYVLSAGDLLIGMDGEFNIARWKVDGALLNQRVCKIIAKDNADEEFLRFALSKALKAIEDRTSFATVKHLSAKELNKLEIPVPPYEEQKKISEILHRLEKVIDIRQNELASLDELIKARFVELFGDSENNSKHWPVYKLDELCDVGSSKRIYQEEQTSEGIPFWRISDLVNKMDVGYANSGLFISQEKYDELKEKEQVPVAGDILVTSRGTLGRCYIISETDKFYFQDGMISWLSKYKHGITPLYIKHLFMTSGLIRQINGMQAGSTVAYLSITMLKKLDIMLPDSGVQLQFAEFVKQVDKSKVAVQKSLEETQTLFDSLMQEYFG